MAGLRYLVQYQPTPALVRNLELLSPFQCVHKLDIHSKELSTGTHKICENTTECDGTLRLLVHGDVSNLSGYNINTAINLK
jgi:hypothetical protein